MCSNKMVSVIIPVYNHENFIEYCIESIVAQPTGSLNWLL